MKTFTGTSLLAYFAGIIVTVLSGTVYDAFTHTFFIEPQPDFWWAFMFVAPGDLSGLGFILLMTMPVYGLLFRFFSGATFRSRLAACFAGLVNSFIGGSFSVFAVMKGTSAVYPRSFWLDLMNVPGAIIWVPIGITIVVFFLVLLIGKPFIQRSAF